YRGGDAVPVRRPAGGAGAGRCERGRTHPRAAGGVRLVARCKMTIQRAVCWLGLAAGIALPDEAAAQTRLSAMQAALDTNTLQGGISAPDPVPAVTPGAVDPGRDVTRPASPIPNPIQGAREPRGNP